MMVLLTAISVITGLMLLGTIGLVLYVLHYERQLYRESESQDGDT